MSGRAEQDRKNEIWIENKLKDAPTIFRYYMVSMRTRTAMTRRAYLGYLLGYNKYLEEQKLQIDKVRPMDIDMYIDYLTKKGNHAQIINAKLSAVISFYNFMIENEMIAKNPCSTKKKMVVDPKNTVVYMTEEEIHEVKESIIEHSERFASRNLCIVTLGCATGLRVSALINIDIDDIDFEKKEIVVIEKGNRKRTIFIGDNTISIIRRWMCDRAEIIGKDSTEKALFISQSTRKRITRHVVDNLLKRHTQMINKNITPHKMRSSCAMKLYNKTGDIYLTAQQLGHSNIRNTMIYAKATDEKKRMAANILDE